MKTYKVLFIEENEIHDWTLEDILSEINKDRSDGWSDYNKADWIEGWNEWVEGEFYHLIGETPDFDDYDQYLDGKDKGTFVGGMGGFVYVDKEGIPDVTFQCPIDEFGEEDGMMYGLESVMIKNKITFEYPIMDVTKGQSYKMAHELREPFRSAFVYHWLLGNSGEIIDNVQTLENVNGIIETGFGKVDVDKIKKAFEFNNQKPSNYEKITEKFNSN